MAIPIRSKPTATFFSVSNTAALTVGTASTNVQIPSGGAHLLLTNVGSNVVYVSLGTDNTVAAVIPATGTPASGIPVLPNSKLMLYAGTGTWIAAISAATGNTLFVTPGNGA